MVRPGERVDKYQPPFHVEEKLPKSRTPSTTTRAATTAQHRWAAKQASKQTRYRITSRRKLGHRAKKESPACGSTDREKPSYGEGKQVVNLHPHGSSSSSDGGGAADFAASYALARFCPAIKTWGYIEAKRFLKSQYTRLYDSPTTTEREVGSREFVP